MFATGMSPEPTRTQWDAASGPRSSSAARPQPPCFGRFRAKSGAARWGHLLRSRRRRGALALATATLGLAVAGCGGGAGGVDPSAPAAGPTPTVAAVASAAATVPVGQGDEVTPGPKTPKAVKAALASGRPVVIGFLYGDTADEKLVGAAVRAASRTGTGRGVDYFVYDVSRKSGFGDLPARLGITETPCVVVIGRDGRVVNVWTGLVDTDMLTQSIASAKESGPRG